MLGDRGYPGARASPGRSECRGNHAEKGQRGGGERGWSLLPPAAGRAGQMDTERVAERVWGC